MTPVETIREFPVMEDHPTKNPTKTKAIPSWRPMDLARFWSRVEVGSDFQCWPWTGTKCAGGYGRYAGIRAHRIACELINGPVPDGLFVLHSCDNRLCCNPRHLRPGTREDNTMDAIMRNRFARGVNAGNSKLTPEQVSMIRTDTSGRTLRSWAEEFGVSESTISYVRSGRSWR